MVQAGDREGGGGAGDVEVRPQSLDEREALYNLRRAAEALDRIAPALENIAEALRQEGGLDQRLRQIISVLMGLGETQIMALSKPDALERIIGIVLSRLGR